MNDRLHIAAIGYTKEDAEEVARLYGIPLRNAVSVKSVLEGGSRGRSFAGYVLQMGFLPPLHFWRAFTPCLMYKTRYTVRELEEMLMEAREYEQTMKLFIDGNRIEEAR